MRKPRIDISKRKWDINCNLFIWQLAADRVKIGALIARYYIYNSENNI